MIPDRFRRTYPFFDEVLEFVSRLDVGGSVSGFVKDQGSSFFQGFVVVVSVSERLTVTKEHHCSTKHRFGEVPRDSLEVFHDDVQGCHKGIV